MAAVSLNLTPDRKALKQFGFIALVAFGLIGTVVLWKGGLFGFSFGTATRTVAYCMFAAGAVSALLSLVAPQANKPLFLGLMIVTYPIGLLISFVIMAVLFYGLITPVGLLFKLIRRDRLRLGIDRSATTYWHERGAPRGAESYFNQF